MEVTLRWITPDAEQVIIDEARVSSNKGDGEEGSGLLRYCVRKGHWSVFEMANMCLRIVSTREITRQIIRHRSFHFQEYSQRYAEQLSSVANIGEARLQDETNRQASHELPEGHPFIELWAEKQKDLVAHANECYQWARANGLAKEVARKVLPEGLTTSDLRMNGTIRDWIHFINLRSGNGTQLECARVAQECGKIFKENLPTIWEAAIG
jgi:thymidylate synthase (FAD)